MESNNIEVLKINKVKLNFSEAVLNIIDLYLSESLENRILNNDWYKTANNKLNNLSNKYKVEFKTVIACTAILSPATNWNQNLKDIETILKAYNDKLDINRFDVSTYGTNKIKAYNLLHSDIVLNHYNYVYGKQANKTASFYLNLLNPDDKTVVTIDRHAVKILLNDTSAGAIKLSTKQYNLASKAYVRAFYILKHIDKFLISPSSVQSITWVKYKKLVNR